MSACGGDENGAGSRGDIASNALADPSDGDVSDRGLVDIDTGEARDTDDGGDGEACPGCFGAPCEDSRGVRVVITVDGEPAAQVVPVESSPRLLRRGTLNHIDLTDFRPSQKAFTLKVGEATKKKGAAVDLDNFELVQKGLTVSGDASAGGISVQSVTDGG